MNVFRQKDSRLAAAEYLRVRVPAGANVLVEPSHNTPPMGSYFTAPSFYKDYVLWRGGQRDDYFHLVGLDPYEFLYRPRPDEREAAAHRGAARRGRLDRHRRHVHRVLRASARSPARVVKQYYQDLLAGQAGIQPAADVQGLSVALRLDIVDDRAELTFRLFDHPRVFIFRRAAPSRQP